MFLTLIETYVDPNVQHPYGKYTNLAPGPFAPSPYWTGYYASRPANKILHHRAVRALLAAETFGKIAIVLQTNDNTAWLPVQTANRDAVNQSWEALEPSTHHDYITGTARDPVYTGEQLPLLGGAVSIAEGARATAISQIAGLVAATPDTGEVPVAIFNPLGLDRPPELVELPAQPGLAASSVRDSNGNLSPVQLAADGALLFQAAAPSLGYASVYLNSQASTTPDPVSVTAAPDQSWFTLSNNQLSVTISRSANWAITSFHPTGDIELTPKDGYPNDLAFYSDQGNIYNFGIEFGDEYFTQVPNDQVLTAGDGAVLESGPLRARVTTQVTFENNQCVAVYTREYTLVSGESQVLISCTGAAPINPATGAEGSDPYSVMVRFPWAGEGSVYSVKMVSISRATAFHWDDAPPAAYWHPPLFVATHDFVVPLSSLGSEFPAIYHQDAPAWAIDASGSLIACLFRNTPGLDSPVGRGANGTDSVITTHRYAVHVPQLETAAGLALLTQARCFQNPLLPVYANVPAPFDDSPSLSIPPQFSLAAVTSGTALITAAKSGQFDSAALVLRVYQPTNSPETITISLAAYIHAYGPVQVAITTALEDQLPGVATLPVKNNSVTFTMNHALTTLLITKAVP